MGKFLIHFFGQTLQVSLLDELIMIQNTSIVTIKSIQTNRCLDDVDRQT